MQTYEIQMSADTHEPEAAVGCTIDGDTAKQLAGVFRALGDPTRLRIISALAEREFCVGELTAALDMAQPAVSHQLRDMRALRLVQSRRDGRHIYYRLDDSHVRDLFAQALAHITHA
jgi:ArsR family transcriptional regulator, lead/cadmium/zinc/bismuth-responsive transcriptional repressor